MIVICISDAPPSLRGDLSKWLIEINVGVYVGRVSARVREELWKRVVKSVKAGRATMVYRAQNEQGMAFRVHNSEWLPIDFDGLKLMLHPSHRRETNQTAVKLGFSNAARKLYAKNLQYKTKRNHQSCHPDSYVILDIETTGLNEIEDEIIEIGALCVEKGETMSSLYHLTRIEGDLPDKITKLTGITTEMLNTKGRDLEDVLLELLDFIKDYPIVAHNALFDMAFIRENCVAFDIQPPKNRVIDTLEISKRLLPECSHRLADLVKFFELPYSGSHRCQFDCENLLGVYRKLIEMEADE